MQNEVPIFISARHIHLKKDDVEKLFGKGYVLQKEHDLGQPRQYACKETVKLVGPKGFIDDVRVLAPLRSETQVEISKTDEIELGINAPIRLSGDLVGTPGVKIVGTNGNIDLEYGVIQAKRHIHFSPSDAQEFGVKHGDALMVEVGGERGIIFDDVIARVDESFKLEMHIDTDEGNAAEIENGEVGLVITKQIVVSPDAIN